VDDNDKSQPPSQLPRLPDAGLFVELGHQGQFDIECFTRGTGGLTQHVRSAIERWGEELGIDCNTGEVVPVVLLYRHNPVT
jgi:hypothetical protein